MGRLEGKVALITGGGAGLGKGCTLALAKEGADLVITGRTQSRLDETAEEVRALGVRCLAVPCDMANHEQIKALVKAAIDEYGTIDILVNNAMSMTKEHRVADITTEELDYGLQNGLFGVLWLMQEVHPYMKEKGWGRIINFNSGAANTGLEGRGAYAAVKGAVHALSRVVGREWGPEGITVNLISPVALNSRAEQDMIKNPEKYSSVNDFAPLRRWGNAESDIGRTVAWLASDEAGYITMNNILADGGAGQMR
jgi:NAD(P)-dependent dehydrogenase (short-subunit alcohol dehydrogenase family)